MLRFIETFWLEPTTQTITSNPQHRTKFSIDYFDDAQQKVKSSLVDNSAELYLVYTPTRNAFWIWS